MTDKSTRRQPLVIPEKSEVFKYAYDFTFAELPAGSKEKELEEMLMQNIEKF